jgi:hypothetical protein
MTRIKQLIILTAAFLLGCSTVANYQATLQNWVGQSEQSLEAGWGAPSSVVISGPTRYLTYARNDGTYVQGGYWGRTVTPLYCSTVFLIQNNLIIQAQFQGNECTSY